MICRVVLAHINRLFCIFIVILWIKFQKRDCADARCPGKAPRLSSRWTEGGAIRGQSPSNSTNAVGAMYPSKLCLAGKRTLGGHAHSLLSTSKERKVSCVRDTPVSVGEDLCEFIPKLKSLPGYIYIYIHMLCIKRYSGHIWWPSWIGGGALRIFSLCDFPFRLPTGVSQEDARPMGLDDLASVFPVAGPGNRFRFLGVGNIHRDQLGGRKHQKGTEATYLVNVNCIMYGFLLTYQINWCRIS